MANLKDFYRKIHPVESPPNYSSIKDAPYDYIDTVKYIYDKFGINILNHPNNDLPNDVLDQLATDSNINGDYIF
jgi:hypothetical protein